MALEYHVKQVKTSWSIPIGGRRINFGFWTSVTTDRVIRNNLKDSKSIDCYEMYKYHPLERPNDIRVVELAPGLPNDPIRVRILHNSCILGTTEKDTKGWSLQYDALSYVWGRPDGQNGMPYILVDDKYSLEVLPNLETALRRFRNAKVARILWIDAICIDQSNDQEKATQVALMLDIYALAQKVQIWIGVASENSMLGMQALKYLFERSLQEPAPWSQLPEGTFLDALNDILRRDWFQRIWVVQEGCVSRKAIITCGNDSFQWENDPTQILKIIRRIKYAAISPQWEEAGLSQVNLDNLLHPLDLQIQHIERQHGEVLRSAPDILDIAYGTRHRKATDRRDKLYAIMGLVAQSDPSFLRPDYTINVEEVFRGLLGSIEV